MANFSKVHYFAFTFTWDEITWPQTNKACVRNTYTRDVTVNTCARNAFSSGVFLNQRTAGASRSQMNQIRSASKGLRSYPQRDANEVLRNTDSLKEYTLAIKGGVIIAQADNCSVPANTFNTNGFACTDQDKPRCIATIVSAVNDFKRKEQAILQRGEEN